MNQMQESSVQSTVKEYSKRPLVVGIFCFVVGVIIGLVVLGWWLWPVQWCDASPAQLESGWQDMGLQVAIIAYGARGEPATAKVEYEALGDSADDTLARVQANPQGIDPNLISQFSAAVGATAQVPPGVTPTAPPAASGRSNLTTLLIVMCVVTLLVGAAIAAYIYLSGRKKTGGSVPASQLPATEVETPAEWTEYSAPSDQAPMAQFMASYKAGDDLFDDSFSIDSPSGEFLGECGVGVAETIAIG